MIGTNPLLLILIAYLRRIKKLYFMISTDRLLLVNNFHYRKIMKKFSYCLMIFVNLFLLFYFTIFYYLFYYNINLKNKLKTPQPITEHHTTSQHTTQKNTTQYILPHHYTQQLTTVHQTIPS